MTKINYTHAEIVFLSGEKLAALRENFSDFQSLDSVQFTPAYLDYIRRQVDELRDIPTDEVMRDYLSNKTDKVKTCMKACREAYKMVKYFVRKRFPNNKAKYGIFGFDEFENVRTSRPKLIVFMGVVYAAIREFETELGEVGMREDQMLSVQTLKEELSEADFAQLRYKAKRRTTTKRRRELQKEMYGFIRQVCRAGKYIYKDTSKAKYEQFFLPKRKKKAPKKDSE